MSSQCILKEIKDEIDKKFHENANLYQQAGQWAKQVLDCRDELSEARKKFAQPAPLRVYTSVSDADNTVFSLRFKGQEVGKLHARKQSDGDAKIELKIDPKRREANGKYFKLNADIFKQTGSFDWQDSKYARLFRAEFKELFQKKGDALPKGSAKAASEHHIESIMLEEMQQSDKDKFGGTCHHIQPVLIGGCPLQCPLPISFSSKKEVNAKRGNIDILARTSRKQLSVWELKKPGIGLGEKPHIQAFTYAYTLLKMLRSEHGNAWWNIFGFKDGTLPPSITIEAVPVLCVTNEERIVKELEEFLRQNYAALSCEHQNGIDKIQFRLAFYALDDKQDPRSVTIPQKYSFIASDSETPESYSFVPTGDCW